MLDCGMVGRLDEELAEGIDDMLMAVVNRNSVDLVDILLRVGSAPPLRPAINYEPTSPISSPTTRASRSRTWTSVAL